MRCTLTPFVGKLVAWIHSAGRNVIAAIFQHGDNLIEVGEFEFKGLVRFLMFKLQNAIVTNGSTEHAAEIFCGGHARIVLGQRVLFETPDRNAGGEIVGD